jgi:acetyl esterase/lipase
VTGGGGTIGDRHSSDAWVDRLGRAGFLTFAVDYTRFAPDGRGPSYPRQETEVAAAARWLRAHAHELGVDANRIVAHGISHGARLGATLLVTPGDAPVAGFVGLYGYYDGFTLYPRAEYGGGRDSRSAAVRARWQQADLTARAAQATGPSFLAVGTADTLVPPDQTTRFADALRSAGKDVELVTVPGAGHGFDRPGGPTLSPDGEAIATRVIAWLDARFG